MPIPEFIVELRKHVGQAPLWLTGVTAVVLRETNAGQEVLMIRRSDTDEWAPVTGIVEPGQEVADAAVREVLEEASVHAVVERLVWVSTSALVTHVNGDQAQYVDHTFRMRCLSGEPAPGDDESTDARWWSVATLPAMRPVFAERIAVVLADEPECRLGPLAQA
ncbi:NUDIX domain-containing protein [Blastococcus sp. Marseille-P5729]|uniref:NUDIX hydrolase n=1 Tax=Blastococcus sp. Marseille-P5729 TaxID=2086582 RepID=UPI000D0F78FF|nr:NUDIX domain-containing protein [Blastococcus sp. Marseille-P5729]